MPKSTDCSISVEFAIALRNLDRALLRQFRCIECGDPVEPHETGVGKDGVLQSAHFEHVVRNKTCSLASVYKSDSAKV